MNRRIASLVLVLLMTAAGFWLLGPRDRNEVTTGPSTIAAGAPMVEVNLPQELSDGAILGQRAFDAVCAACHGANGAGQQGVAPPLIHKTYEPGHHADMAFYLAVQNGVRSHHWRFGDMPPVEGLTRADVTSIVAYVREVQRENGID